MVCLYLRVYSIIFYVVRQVVGGSFSPRGGVPLPLGYPAGGAPPAGLEPGRHWLNLPPGYPAGGGLSLSPAYPAVCVRFAPYPPAPLPRRGRGGLKVILCKGLRPLHPRG